MGKAARDNRPHLKPVQSIEVNTKHLSLRLALLILFAVVGVSAIAYGVKSYFTRDESGWQEVAASADGCGEDFALLYEFGQGELSPGAEYNALSALYDEATVRAYQLFHEVARFEDVYNVAYLNDHPNETVTVDEVLYEAFAKLDAVGTRQPYLGPMAEYYINLFLCTSDWDTADYDPQQNEAVAALFAELLPFINDPQAVNLELLGNNRVRLNVSEAYLRFAEENDVVTFYSFHFMKNAFIADYLAQTLAAAGYTHGTISSYDGYSRNLDERGVAYGFNLFDRVDNTIYPVATWNYSGKMAIVSLRSFPVSEEDAGHYYVLASGETRHAYLSTESGLPTAAVNELTCYSPTLGCADMLLAMLPIYIAEDFAPAVLADTPGLELIYCSDGTLYYTEESVYLTDLYSSDVFSYEAEQISAAK